MSFPQWVVDELLVASLRCCCLCHRHVGMHIEIHHIVPKSEGGTDDLDNGIPLCYECHAKVEAYNRQHPRGRKYQPAQLRQYRDEWLAQIREGRVMLLEGSMVPVPTFFGSTGAEPIRWQDCADCLRTTMALYVCQMQTRLAGADVCPNGPYKGLFHFELSDAAIFFGRQESTRRLLAQIIGRGRHHRLTILYGATGVGKTSLIHAGLMPALLRSGKVPVTARAYAAPDVVIRRSILGAAPPDKRLPEQIDDLSLHYFLRLTCSGLAEQELVILLDQFEDFFIRQESEARALFVDQLASCYDDDALPVRFVLSLRKDFLADLDEFRAAIPHVLDNRFRLDPLTRDQAADAITQPVTPLGITYDPALVNRVLGDLDREGIQPPQLQIVCQALFSYAQTEGRARITEADYQGMNGTRGILRNYLEQQLCLFGDDRALARNVMEEMITSEKTRKSVTLLDLAVALGTEPASLPTVIEKLVGVRLLRIAESENQTEKTYELAHECLADVFELSAEAIERKLAQERIARWVKDWTKHRLVVPLDRLKLIDGLRDSLRLDVVAQEVLLHSALRSGYEVKYWLSRLLDRDKASQIARDENRAHPALWGLGTDLPLGLRIRVGFSVLIERFGAIPLVIAPIVLVVLIVLVVATAGLQSQVEVSGEKLDALVPRVNFAGIIPEDWQLIKTYYLDTNHDAIREWLILYQFDLPAGMEERAAPIAAAIYQLDESRPPNLVSHALHSPDSGYLCECICTPTMENVLSGLAGDELVFRDRCGEQASRLTIFHWDPDKRTYQPIGHFVGDGIEVNLDKVLVYNRSQDRAQLSTATTYYARDNRTYYGQDLPGTLVPFGKQEIVFSRGEPDDVLRSPYPENVVLAFYNHYNEDEQAPMYFSEKVRDRLGQCNAGDCGCAAPRHEISHVRVTDLQVETHSEAQYSDLEYALVGVRVVCEHRYGRPEAERYIRWQLAWEDDRWQLERPE